MDDYKWQDKDGRTFILIKVKPGSKRTVINGTIDVKTVYPVKKALSISISSQPEDNKANRELIEFMADNLKVPKSNVSITHGLKNRLKVISVIS